MNLGVPAVPGAPVCGVDSSLEAMKRGLWGQLCCLWVWGCGAALHTGVGMARLPAVLLVISCGGEGKKPHGAIYGVGL